MTTKTETLYRPKNEAATRFLDLMPERFEPVQVHVGEFYKKVQVDTCGDHNAADSIMSIDDYEKVTHVLPDSHWLDVPRIIELQKKVEELENQISEWEITDAQRLKTIESQKREIQQLKKAQEIWGNNIYMQEIDRLKSELEETKAELESETKWAHEYHGVATALENQLEEAKKGGVKWEKIISEIKCRIDYGADSKGHLEGLLGLFEPQPRTVEDEAQVAWENSNLKNTANILASLNGLGSYRIAWIKDFKAAKESHGQV